MCKYEYVDVKYVAVVMCNFSQVRDALAPLASLYQPALIMVKCGKPPTLFLAY